MRSHGWHIRSVIVLHKCLEGIPWIHWQVWSGNLNNVHLTKFKFIDINLTLFAIILVYLQHFHRVACDQPWWHRVPEKCNEKLLKLHPSTQRVIWDQKHWKKIVVTLTEEKKWKSSEIKHFIFYIIYHTHKGNEDENDILTSHLKLHVFRERIVGRRLLQETLLLFLLTPCYHGFVSYLDYSLLRIKWYHNDLPAWTGSMYNILNFYKR